MKLSRIKNSRLSRCKNFIFSDGYLVGFTGRQVLLFDGNLNFIRSCGAFSYAYTGEASPQKDKILILSNENRFYVNAFPSLEPIGRVTIRAPYNHELEGMGCWSLDGRYIFTCVTNGKTLNSALRIYNADDFSEFTDNLSEKYCLTEIHSVPSLQKYYLVGFNRQDSKEYLIWYDGRYFEEFVLEGFDDIVTRSIFNEKHGWLELYTDSSVFVYDFCGRLKNRKSLKTQQEYEISFSDVLSGSLYTEEQKTEIRELSARLGMEHIAFSDCVRDVAVTKDRTVAYIATDHRVIAYDMLSRKIIDQITIGYGVEKVREISANKIIVSSWSGVLIYELR